MRPFLNFLFLSTSPSPLAITAGEQLDAAYQEVKDVVCIGRGIGLWGDMVVTLRDGSKIEMRAVPQFRELKDYIIKRRDELTGGQSGGEGGAAGGGAAAKGFA
jgi:hypothetical protein